MKFFGKTFFEKKAVGDRAGFSYNGATFGFNTDINTNIGLYYKLYRENTDLRRCVEELYQTTGKDGFILLRGENTVVENTNIINALNFENGFNTLKSLIIRDLQIAGNVFILPVKNGLNNIIGFQVLDPRTIRIVANKYGEVIRYIQTRGGNVQDFMPDEIFHFKDMIDPDNEIQGISKIETLVYSLSSNKEAERSNYAFFKNNAIPSTLIILENDLNEDEIKNAIITLKSQFSGGSNKHKISASAGIKDIKQLGGGISDMEFGTLSLFTTEKVCAAMGVPKTILGYSDGINYSTSDNQYRKYIENTIRPLQYQLENIINLLIREIDSSVRLEFLDLNQFDFSQKVTDYEKLLGMGVITSDEIREELGYDAISDNYGNKRIIKQGYELLEDVGVNSIIDLPSKV